MSDRKPAQVINMHQAKTHLSRLAERAHQGEEIILAKAGKPYAKLVPLEPRGRQRVPGLLKALVIKDEILEPEPPSGTARARK